jgi:predicted chitinase
MTTIAFDQLSSLAPHMKQQYKDAFQAADVGVVLDKYEISKAPLRICHFLAQALTETGALTTLVESLNYSASRLTEVWPSRFPTLAAAQPYAHDEEKLGNAVYGGRMGNANPGDGFLFRGRGLLQITGRSAYTHIGQRLGFDLVGNPDQAFDPAHCLEIAAAEWAASGWGGKSCNELADDDNVLGVTRAINGGLIGIEDRKAWLAKAKAIWLPQRAIPQLASRAVANLTANLVSEIGIAPVLAAPFDPARATSLGKFVEAAYSMFTANPENLMPPPSSDFPSGYRLAASIQMQDFVITGTGPVFYGFMAQSTTDPTQFVLAFRGTSDWVEWWDDANDAGTTPFKIPGVGSVGEGFARIYDTIELVEYPTSVPTAAAVPRSFKSAGGLSRQVAALVAEHAPTAALAASAPGGFAMISVAGHSLGAALATLYVMENATTDKLHNPLICTFASPRVGDAAFVAAFNGLGLTSWRIANGPDLVPYLPPQFLGFTHIDALVPVSSAGKAAASVSCWHSLATYLSLLDPTLPLDPACRITAAAATEMRSAPFVGRPTLPM